jgi:hypothetical protein
MEDKKAKFKFKTKEPASCEMEDDVISLHAGSCNFGEDSASPCPGFQPRGVVGRDRHEDRRPKESRDDHCRNGRRRGDHHHRDPHRKVRRRGDHPQSQRELGREFPTTVSC